MKKKVLIVTYYWSPAGGSGVQRWVKFAKYLPCFDIEPIIYTPENPTYPILDSSMEQEIPKDLTVIKQPIWEPYNLANRFSKKNQDYNAGFYDHHSKQNWKTKLSLFIRGNFFIPDARKFWIKPSVRFLKSYIQQEQIDTFITTGPPHSMHLIGLRLKNQFPHLKWIADFRDPWTNVYYYPSLKLTRWANRKHKRLEQRVLNTADFIISVTSDYQLLYQNKTSKPVYCLTNGFDTLESSLFHSLDSRFSIAYIGAMFKERNPQILWKVLNKLSSENKTFAYDLSIKLIGKFDDSILKDIHTHRLEKNLDFKGYLSHKEALIEQQRSQILLLVTANQDDKKGNIPGKLFEYISSKRPIIAFGPKESQIEKILNQTQTGKYFLFDDEDALEAYILYLYQQFKTNNLTIHSKNINQFHRKNITEELSRIIKN
ncbi:MAG: glycosyltransferase [Flavobacteriales bacterium]